MATAAGGMTLGALAFWALVAIALIIAIIAIVMFFRSHAQKTAALGTIAGVGGTPPARGLTQSWTNPPAQITVGTPATFILTVTSLDVMTGALRPVQGRQYIINVQPGANLSIQSVTGGLTVAPGAAQTSAAGTINVVIIANSVPAPPAPDQLPAGSLVAVQINDTSAANPVTANFTVR